MLDAIARSQSALDPAGSPAGQIAMLWWIMAVGAAAILLGVTVLTLYTVFGDPARRDPRVGMHLIRVGGLAFPLVTLTALLVLTLTLGRGLTKAGEAALRIEVVGKQWWWEVRYPGEDPRHSFVTANELRIPVGREVEVIVSSPDVIHSFWVPSLAGKIDMIPGHVNRLTFKADRPGVYRGQCAEYCGLQHARMALFVVVETQDAFAAWLERQRRPAPEPAFTALAEGRAAFLEAGCGACHTVRGTPARGELGPDLTHVGGRLSLAAGTLPNGVGPMAGWIVASQHLKPGNQMPSFNQFDGPTLRALAMWLTSLE
jgi:cytochrome c oxidase subunit II